MRNLWIYAWAYIYVALGLIDRLGDWMEDQVDHNDYLAGAIGTLAFMAIPYVFGIIDIVVRG